MLSITPDPANEHLAKISITLPWTTSTTLAFQLNPRAAATSMVQRYLDNAGEVHLAIAAIVDQLMGNKPFLAEENPPINIPGEK